MKRFKLIAKLSLALALIISIFSVYTVFAATYIVDGDWKFEKTTSESNVIYYVAAYTGVSDKIQIPALCQDIPVTKINNNTFLNKTELTYIGIPATITAIGMNAFYGCSGLESISIPASVKEIGPNAFYSCTSLSTLDFRNDSELKSIPQNTFSGCSSLTTVALPEGLTSIGRNAFFGCTNLAAVTFGPYVTEIDSSAFKDCSAITIFGWNDTYPQQFAKDNNIPFISLGDYVYPTEPTEPTSTDPVPTESVTVTGTQSGSDPAVTDPVSTETTTTDPTEPTKYPQGKIYIIGDTDLSGKVTVKDATLIQKYAADMVMLDKIQLFLGNCNSVGDVNVKDATQIQKYCAGYSNIRFVGTEVEL